MAQSLAKIYIHAIFSTKNRQPLLDSFWRDELYDVLGGAANNLGCQSLLVGGVCDHIHILFQLARTICPADAIGKIKSTSSAWLNQNRFNQNPCDQNQRNQTQPTPNPFHWQNGYGAFSVSQSNVDAVMHYIATQEEHHQRQTYQDEFREWLRRYQINWDERYVWD